MRPFFLCLLELTASACVEQLPPAQSPAPVARSMGTPPPVPEGYGRVLVDVVDGPTAVRRLDLDSVALDVGQDRALSGAARSSEVICDSPCLLNLPYGRHALAFPVLGSERRLEIDAVVVGGEPTVYRRALGTWEPAGAEMVLGIIGTALGGAAVVTGISLASVGFGIDEDAMKLAGTITLGSGGIVATLGILGIALSPAMYRPGASVQFPWATAAPQ